jgi:hypothetical protein
MKKQLLNLSFVAVALALYITANAVPTQPLNEMVIPGTMDVSVMEVDGLAAASECYGEVQATTDFNSTGRDAGDADFQVTFQAAYDLNYLYLFINVTDDVDHSYDGENGNSYEFDNVEVFLQLDTLTVGNVDYTSGDSVTIQLRINRGLDSVETPGRAAKEDYLYYQETNPTTGWIQEVAIPWSAVLPLSYTNEDMFDLYISDEGHIFGFDFSGADSDGTTPDAGARDIQVAWDMDDLVPDDAEEDNAWHNSADFGLVTLQKWDALAPAAVENTLNAYPNPATNEITFNVEGEVNIEVYSITGSLVMVANTATVDVSALSSGMYIAKDVVNNVTTKFSVK